MLLGRQLPPPAALYRARRPPPQAGEVKRIRGRTDSIKNHPALATATDADARHRQRVQAVCARQTALAGHDELVTNRRLTSRCRADAVRIERARVSMHPGVSALRP